MQKRYNDDVIVIIFAFSNAIIIIFVDLFDNVYAKSSVRQIVISVFEYVLTFPLTIIDHKYDFNLVISLFILAFNSIYYFLYFSLLDIVYKFRNLHYDFRFLIVNAI